jgi:hypothetical protein
MNPGNTSKEHSFSKPKEKIVYLNNYHYKSYQDDSKEWCKNGVYHREDGPAIEYSNGRKDWYIHGLLHRKDGPAIEDMYGDKFWYKNGKPHREDGPAFEYKDGGKEWYINGEYKGSDNDFTNESWKYFQKTLLF